MTSEDNPIKSSWRPIQQKPDKLEPQNSYSEKYSDYFDLDEAHNQLKDRKTKKSTSCNSLNGKPKKYKGQAKKSPPYKSCRLNGSGNENGYVSNNGSSNLTDVETDFQVEEKPSHDGESSLVAESKKLNLREEQLSAKQEGSRLRNREKKEKNLEKKRARRNKHANYVDINVQNMNTAMKINDIEHRINEAMETESPRKRKLTLSKMGLTFNDIPTSKICEYPLNNTLHKLSLAFNPLSGIPDCLVRDLTGLQKLDLRECNLQSLPQTSWNLPNLRILDLSCNQLAEFPDEAVLQGIPNIEELNLFNNDIVDISLPDENSETEHVLLNLKSLNIGFNQLTHLPDDINKLQKLTQLNVANNLLLRIPQSICELDLRTLEVAANPLKEPPLETCLRGIESIKRYYRCILKEENKQSDKKQRKLKHKSSSFKKKKRKSSLKTVKSYSSLYDDGSVSGTLETLTQNTITLNDTLKVIFVGKSEAGKTSVIRRIIHGLATDLPSSEKRTIGVDIYEWDPKKDNGISADGAHLDTQIKIDESLNTDTEVDVKFRIWDFAGQNVYHATHELFFSQSALYVIVWDMGAKNIKTWAKQDSQNESEHFMFYESPDEDDENEECNEALEEDIDENVQFWVNCIQSCAPGAAILPICSCNDRFVDNEEEGKRRSDLMKKRLNFHEEKKLRGREERFKKYESSSNSDSNTAKRYRNFSRPKLLIGEQEDVIRVSCTSYTGFDSLKERIVQIATSSKQDGYRSGFFAGHIGCRIPHTTLRVKKVVREFRKDHSVVKWDMLCTRLLEIGIDDEDDIKDSLVFLSKVGELAYFEDSTIDSRDMIVDETKENNVINFQLSDYLFVNPNWLVSAIACILRHDLGDRIASLRNRKRCLTDVRPWISSEDVSLLWDKNSKVKKAVESMNGDMHSFLQQLLVWFCVFVPIDYKIHLGGIQVGYFERVRCPKEPQFYFLPSLLSSVEPSDDFFSYKTGEASKLTLCHSWLLHDCVPPGFMERIISSALRSVKYVKNLSDVDKNDNKYKEVQVEEVMCWRNAFYFQFCNIKIFVRILGTCSELCVASKNIFPHKKRLSISGQGYDTTGKGIWNGGFDLIKKSIERVVSQYSGLEYSEEVICPECLYKRNICEARSWDIEDIRKAISSEKPKSTIFCENAHKVNLSMLSGIYPKHSNKCDIAFDSSEEVKVTDPSISGAFVLIVVCSENKIIGSGSGFIADKNRGLIITAAHVIFNFTKGDNFGEELGDTIIIGVMPNPGDQVIFRYIAQISDLYPDLTVDACVLKIWWKLETDINDQNDICSVHKKPRTLLFGKKSAYRKEKLTQLSLNENYEVEQQIRIVGFAQSTHNVKEGSWLFNNLSCARGSVRARWINPERPDLRNEFFCYEEMVVSCYTICGESGGPCINQQGQVIGILSRGIDADLTSYIAPTGRWMHILQQGKECKIVL